ncbi:MAG: C25 family cysteine peptidase [Chitinophagales bacterium]
MKYILKNIVPVLLMLLTFSASAQPFGNEWIDFTKQYYKIKVAKKGLYRINKSTLNQAQIPNVPGANFNLYRNGEAVPFYASTSGIMGSNDYIEFYGEPNDGSLDAELYTDPDWQLNPNYSLFNDTAAYYLAWNTSDPNLPVNNVANDLSNLPSAENYYWKRNLLQFNAIFNAGKPYYLGTQPSYRAIFDEGEGFYDGVISKGNSRAYNLNAPDLYSGGPSATVNTSVISISNTPHRVIIEWNNNVLDDNSFTGFATNKHNFSINNGQIGASNTLRVSSSGTGNADNNAVSHIEFTYPATFDMQGVSLAKMTLPGGSGTRYLEITDFNNRGTAPVLYDLTNQIRIEGQNTSGTLQFKLPAVPNNNERKLVLSSQASPDVITVNNIRRATFINYNNPSFQGDFIIIYHPALTDDGNGNNYINDYANYRSSMNGGNYNVQIVNIEQLYDQFAYGVQKHPLAIRNFAKFAMARWSPQPEYFFLLGKGRVYDRMRKNTGVYNQCLIPTFGNTGEDFGGADQLLTASSPGSIAPQISIARLSTLDPQDINHYLEKIIDFEEEQRKVGDPHQTIANKSWMKRVLHLGGGTGAAQQNTFKFYLDDFKSTIVDTSYGADVESFFKTTSSPIQIAQSQRLTDLINDGTSMITFFGHSSPNSFDIALDNPQNYTNYKRYPVILSNGCFTGNIFSQNPGISADFIFARNKAAIGFLATTSLSSSSGLFTYSNQLYKQLGQELYGESIGHAIKAATAEIEQCCSFVFNLMIAEEMTLHGDPSIHINTHTKPDYVLEPQMISFNPSNVSVNLDSFEMQVIVTNIGKAIKDSIDLEVIRNFPNGSGITIKHRMSAPYFKDTVYLNIPTGGSAAFGLNNFKITIESEYKISELSETNNTLGTTINILSEDVFPIHPYEFSIEYEQGIELNASTANAFAGMKNYIMQIDTTELFNSSKLQTTNIQQSGGILKWTPSLLYEDSVVYYWRVGIDSTSTPGTSARWRYSSFIYLEEGEPGWNQSHYYQYLKDDYRNIYLDNDRIFKFTDDIKGVTVSTGLADLQGGNLPWGQLAYSINSRQGHNWNCGGSGGFSGGLTFAVFDSVTGEPWISSLDDIGTSNSCSGNNVNQIYGNIHCKQRDFEAFPFPTSSSCWQNKIIDFINMIPDGHYVLIYSVNNAGYTNFSPQLINALNNLGANLINTATQGSNTAPWVFFVKKGDQSTAEEEYKPGANDIINFSTQFSASWYSGQYETPLIGPARKWKQFLTDYHSSEPNSFDENSVDIIGVNNAGIETVLINNFNGFSTSLLNIDPKQYPFLKLRMNSRDDSTRTPVQLDYWRILYDKVPEAALNPSIGYTFKGDTLEIGQELQLRIKVENVTDLDMDSLLIKYVIFSGNNSSYPFYTRGDSLRGHEIMEAAYDFNTNCNCLGKVNSLFIEVNPDDDQPEQFHFNNIGLLNFSISGDLTNPLLDVTFDGVHILDGDLVSAEPEILVKLKDENKFLALNDTSLIKMFIKYPDGSLKPQHFDNNQVIFTPASNSNLDKDNTAQIEINKRFEQDGVYELMVQAQDRSKNQSGNYGYQPDGIDYRISFEVINEAQISNVMNYPNPFTSSTRFIFTLTGSQIPDYMKIQIFTITGKVVREISQAELGEIRIGRNMTDYAWDGRDQYGDPLANGVYIYRVVTSIDGEKLEKYDTGTDKYFKRGFGKMYLAR